MYVISPISFTLHDASLTGAVEPPLATPNTHIAPTIHSHQFEEPEEIIAVVGAIEVVLKDDYANTISYNSRGRDHIYD